MFAKSLFYEMAEVGKDPSVESVQFPRVLEYFFIHYFKKVGLAVFYIL